MQPRIRDDAEDSSGNNNLDQNRPNDTTIVVKPRSEVVKGLSGSKRKMHCVNGENKNALHVNKNATTSR